MIPNWPAISNRIRAERGFLLRYAIVGATVTAIDFVTFAALLSMTDGRHTIANAAAKIFGAGLGFLLHRNYTFAVGQRPGVARQGGAYLALLVFNLALSAGLVFLLIDIFAIPKLPARAFSDVVVIAVSFLGSRFVVFRQAPSERGGAIRPE